MKRIYAADIRPGHYMSFSGYESDSERVAEVKLAKDLSGVIVTLDCGTSRTFPVDFPVNVEE